MLGLLLLTRWAASRAKVPAALEWLTRNVRAVWLGLIGAEHRRRRSSSSY